MVDLAGRVTPCAPVEARSAGIGGQRTARPALKSLDDALGEIGSRCQPLPAVRVPLAEAFGRVLRETVCAPEDLPDCDRSTRDGYAILQNDVSETFQVVDTLHAADWKPRELKTGEAVRVATGAPLPCENLRVVMQENVERNGDRIKILKRENALNLRQRGEDVQGGRTPRASRGAAGRGRAGAAGDRRVRAAARQPAIARLSFHDRRRNYSAGPDAKARPNPRQQFDFDSRLAATSSVRRGANPSAGRFRAGEIQTFGAR